MESIDFITIFATSVAALLAFLLVFSYVTMSRKRLAALGYSGDYIAFLRRDRGRRLLAMALAIPLLELAAAGIIYLLTGPLESGTQLLYTLIAFLILVIPFPLRDRYVTQRRLKKLAMQGSERIVADLNYSILHRMFRPSWELAVTLLYAGLMLWVHGGFHIALIHLMILWLLYFTVRGTKNANRPALREAYLLTLAFMMINHALLLFHLADLLRCCAASMTAPFIAWSVLLLALIGLKSVYYLVQLPALRRALHTPAA